MTYKANWATGDILLAADQNALAVQQFSRFADATARNAAITSPSEGQACWLSDVNEFQIYSGAAWVPLLDVDTISVTSGNYTISTDLTVSGNVTIQSLDMDTIVEGDVIYGSAADTLARLAKGSDTEVLTLASGVPSWAAAGGVSWSGSTANGLGTYGSSSSIVSESSATYNGTTLSLTTSGGGLKLDGLASSDAHTLDDYEEGTAAVTLTASGGGTITVGGSNTIAYTKIGRVVHIQGELDVASVSSPLTQLNIVGLPFTSSNTLTDLADRSWLSTSVYFLSAAVESGDIIAMIGSNSTSINYFSGGGGDGVQYFANLVDSGTGILIGGSYITDS